MFEGKVELYIPRGSASASLLKGREENAKSLLIHFGCAYFDDTIGRLFGPGLADTGFINCTAF